MDVFFFLALHALSSQTGTARCEIHFLNEKGTQFRAVNMSLGGDYLLAESGVKPGITAIVSKGDKTTRLPLRNLAEPNLLGVDDGGTILASFINRAGPGVHLLNGVLIRNDEYLVLRGVDIEGVGGVIVRPRSFGRMGQVFGGIEFIFTENLKILRGGHAVIWRNRGPHLVFTQSDSVTIAATHETGRGLLGYTSLMYYRRTGWTRWEGRGGDPFPVFFRNGQVEPLALPSGFQYGEPTAATPTGDLIFGVIGPTIFYQTPVLWQEEVPYLPTFHGKIPPNCQLVSVSDQGKLAVGRLTEKNRQHAVIWEKGKEIRLLTEVARERGILLPAGWHFTEAVAVDPTGDRVYGTAIDYRNRRRPFLLWLNPRPKENR